MRFNSKLATLAFATTAAITSFGAQASSIDIKVTGTINPAACVPTLTGNGVYDYGKIPGSTLSLNGYTKLEEKKSAFTITCDQPAKVGLRIVDNRSASLVPLITKAIAPQSDDATNFGLGAVSGKNVGGYMVNIQGLTVDTVAASNVYSTDSGVNWTRGGSTAYMSNNSKNVYSWAPTGNAPIAFRKLDGTLTVQAVLNKTSELPLTGDVDLDGFATIELVYL